MPGPYDDWLPEDEEEGSFSEDYDRDYDAEEFEKYARYGFEDS